MSWVQVYLRPRSRPGTGRLVRASTHLIHTSFADFSSSVFQHPDVKPANVFVDAVSLGLMKGSVIDFAKELIGTSFRVEDNPQVSIAVAVPPDHRVNFWNTKGKGSRLWMWC